MKFRAHTSLGWLLLTTLAAQGQSLGTTNLLEGPAAGADGVVLAVTPATNAWSATANDPWLHLSAANQNGTGSTNIIFSFDANPGPTRSGTLTVAGQTLAVTQAGATYVPADPLTKLVSSGIGGPGSVAVDGAGNVYIADIINNAVRKWTAASGTVTKLFASGLGGPGGLAVDSAGNVYFADTGNNAIKKWTAATRTVSTLVSSGLNQPYGVAVDGAGNVYFADSNNSAIKQWTAATGTVTTLVSSGLNHPNDVAVDDAGQCLYCRRKQ